MKKSDAKKRIDVKSIKDPSIVKELDSTQLAFLCHDLRSVIIKATSLKGGHLSANLGAIEITVALHRVFDFHKDKLIFDVGHQSYAHKLLTGRSLDHLNEEGGVSGFQSRSESPFDPYDAGHSSTSLSAAEAFAFARDEKKEDYDVVALIGDASIVNGLAFEALNNIGARKNKVIVVLNDNEMSITRPMGALGKFFRKISTGKAYNKMKKGYERAMFRSALGKRLYRGSYAFKTKVKQLLVPTTMFDNMGFTYIGPVDGHNIKKLEKAFRAAKNATKSVIIHCSTIKGKGYSYAEKDKTGYWHGVTPFDIETGKPKKMHPGYISYSHYLADVTMEMMEKHPDAVLVTPATLKGAGLDAVFKQYPSRSIDVGIAEEHALTFAGALSIAGNHPIVSIYSTFLQRAYDEISHDCARMGSNMTLLIDRAGLAGANGATHQGIYDEAYLKTIPNLVLSMPSGKEEAKALYEESFNDHGVFGIRFPREFVPEGETKEIELPFGRFRFLKKGSNKKLVIISVGPKSKELLRLMEKEGIDATLIDPVYLFPLNEDDLKEIGEYENLLIHDAYGTEEGFAKEVSFRLAKMGLTPKLTILALPNAFIPFAPVSSQEKNNEVDIDKVVSSIKGILG